MKYLKYWYLFIFLLKIDSLVGQSLKKEKMEHLSFMVGEWIGTSSVYKNGKITQQAPAFEKISYDLNRSIIVIELNSERLKLHTIIQFNEEDDTYYYSAFYENGGRRLTATFTNGQFVVKANESKRFIFEKNGENGFREYGEELIDGKWVKYFEDNFTNTQ